MEGPPKNKKKQTVKDNKRIKDHTKSINNC